MIISHPLTDNDQYFLDLTLDQEARRLVATVRPANPELPYQDLATNIEHLLKIEMDGKIYNQDNSVPDSPMTWVLDTTPIKNIKVLIRNINFGEYAVGDSGVAQWPVAAAQVFSHRNSDVLSPFELRMLARGVDSAIASQVPYDRSKFTTFRPKTDLHTHFAGNITVDNLIAVGSKNGTRYPINLLRELGIQPSQDQWLYDSSDTEKRNPKILLKDLTDTDVNKLKAVMAIPIDRQATFNDMERIYRYRSPITKDINNFGDFLATIANEYQKQGIKYAELSISDIVDPRYLAIAHQVLPDLERTTGVQLRFLASLWRHSEPEWNRYEGERIKLAAERSPYIVGVDWMGQETNSTYAIADSFKQLAAWAQTHNPNFIFRVHAGENPLQPENVGVAAELAEKYSVKLRVGHGLYGVNAEVMYRLKRIGAVIEFNMNSNMALNNLDSSSGVPIKKYVDYGIQAVLGQDGHGIYHTSARSEALAASLAGVTTEQFSHIARFESGYIHHQMEDFERRSKLPLAFKIPSADEYPSRAEAEAKSAAAVAAADQHLADLKSHIVASGISMEPEAIKADTQGKTPLWLGLASASSWPKINPEHQAEIIRTFQLLIDNIDPTKAYFITGGEDIGSAQIFHRLAQARRQDGLVIVGTTVAESKLEDFRPATITHAIVVAQSWYDKASAVTERVLQDSGEAIFFGGGAIVSDEITTAINNGIGVHLMGGPVGASTQKARVFPERGFKTAEMLITRLYDTNPDIFDQDKVQPILSGAIATVTTDLPEFTLEEFGTLHSENRLGQGFVVSQVQGSPRPIFFLDSPMTLHAHDGKGNFDNTRQLSSGAIIVFGAAPTIAPLVQQVSQLIESDQAGTDEFQHSFAELKDKISKYANFYEYGDLGASIEAKKAQLASATLGGKQALAEGKELSGVPISGLGILPEKWGSHFDDLVGHFAREARFLEKSLPLPERESIARSFLTQALGETRSYPRALPADVPTHAAYRYDEPIKIGEYNLPAGSWAVLIQDDHGNVTDLRPVSAINNGRTYAVVAGDPYYVNGASVIGQKQMLDTDDSELSGAQRDDGSLGKFSPGEYHP